MWVIDHCILSHWIIIIDSLLLSLLCNSAMNLIHCADTAFTRPQSVSCLNRTFYYQGTRELAAPGAWAEMHKTPCWGYHQRHKHNRSTLTTVAWQVSAETSHMLIPTEAVWTRGQYTLILSEDSEYWWLDHGLEGSPISHPLLSATKHLLPGRGPWRGTLQRARLAVPSTRSSTRWQPLLLGSVQAASSWPEAVDAHSIFQTER